MEGEHALIVLNRSRIKSGDDRDPETVALEGQFMWGDTNQEQIKLEERSVGCDYCDEQWAEMELWENLYPPSAPLRVESRRT